MTEYTRAELKALIAQMLDREITPSSLAKIAGLNEGLVTEIMKGRIRPSVNVRQDLARALNVNPSRIRGC